MKTLTNIGGAILIVLLLFLGVFIYTSNHKSELGLATANFINYASDVVGTKTGTSTVGVNFNVTATGGQTATSSYVSKIGSADMAIYTFKVLNASSSANILFDIQGSNDDYCETSTSTTIFDQVTTSQINWFSAGDHFLNKVHSTSLSNASSTVSMSWNNPAIGVGNEVILDNLNYQCLKLNLTGSSTILWAQIRTK